MYVVLPQRASDFLEAKFKTFLKRGFLYSEVVSLNIEIKNHMKQLTNCVELLCKPGNDRTFRLHDATLKSTNSFKMDEVALSCTVASRNIVDLSFPTLVVLVRLSLKVD